RGVHRRAGRPGRRSRPVRVDGPARVGGGIEAPVAAEGREGPAETEPARAVPGPHRGRQPDPGDRLGGPVGRGRGRPCADACQPERRQDRAPDAARCGPTGVRGRWTPAPRGGGSGARGVLASRTDGRGFRRAPRAPPRLPPGSPRPPQRVGSMHAQRYDPAVGSRITHETAPYSALADVYDTIMADVEYDDWAEFIVALARARGLPGGRVLDVGCGTGNATGPLHARGFEVVGVDASE